MTPIRIGYVGVGLMGLPMVKRLVSLGYAVRAYDIVPAQTDAARAAGAPGRGVARATRHATSTSSCSTCRPPTRWSRRCSARDGVAHALAAAAARRSTSRPSRSTRAARSRRGCARRPAAAGSTRRSRAARPRRARGTLTVMAGGDADGHRARRAADGGHRERASRTWGRSARGLVGEDDQPAHRRLPHAVMAEALLLAEARGHRRGAHPRVPRRRPRRRHAAAEALSAHGRARFRAAGLRAPAAEGPRDGQRVRRRR